MKVDWQKTAVVITIIFLIYLSCTHRKIFGKFLNELVACAHGIATIFNIPHGEVFQLSLVAIVLISFIAIIKVISRR